MNELTEEDLNLENRRSGRMVLVDGLWGIHVPERFIDLYSSYDWNIGELVDELEMSLKKTEENPLDTEEILKQGDIWDEILREAYYVDDKGQTWYLEQDGDLFAVREEDDEY